MSVSRRRSVLADAVLWAVFLFFGLPIFGTLLVGAVLARCAMEIAHYGVAAFHMVADYSRPPPPEGEPLSVAISTGATQVVRVDGRLVLHKGKVRRETKGTIKELRAHNRMITERKTKD